jgi:hypothetical protein
MPPNTEELEEVNEYSLIVNEAIFKQLQRAAALINSKKELSLSPTDTILLYLSYGLWITHTLLQEESRIIVVDKEGVQSEPQFFQTPG